MIVGKSANLGSTSSQRSESYHPVLRQITNAQLSLEDSARNLCRKITSILKDLSTDEQNSMRKYPRLAQSYIFHLYDIRLLLMRLQR